MGTSVCSRSSLFVVSCLSSAAALSPVRSVACRESVFFFATDRTKDRRHTNSREGTTHLPEKRRQLPPNNKPIIVTITEINGHACASDEGYAACCYSGLT